ncbi:Rz1-like lysis system protein LysC [Gilliamella mensalis]|uniref:Rz1-like lysis system protein LysC n=1 Tax=Gilliamella mensalis TaxID=1908520 RepID=UPI001FC95812|nr:Rz1-like lysis system protein LysC [Gilliamella mensalis]
MICPILLNGCTHGQKSKEVQIIKAGCPVVTPCYLPMNNLRHNRSLLDDNQAILTAWHQCALQVEIIYQCQQEQNQH